MKVHGVLGELLVSHDVGDAVAEEQEDGALLRAELGLGEEGRGAHLRGGVREGRGGKVGGRSGRALIFLVAAVGTSPCRSQAGRSGRVRSYEVGAARGLEVRDGAKARGRAPRTLASAWKNQVQKRSAPSA